MLINTQLSDFSDSGILVGSKWYFIVIFIYISLMTKDVKHFFICLQIICMSSLEKSLIKSFAHYLIRLFVSLLLHKLCRFIQWKLIAI